MDYCIGNGQVHQSMADIAGALNCMHDQQAILKIGGGEEMAEKTVVRRLTELECERLQGFPDNWTLIGEPEEVEVKDYEITYEPSDEPFELKEIKTFIGTHKEMQYRYTDSTGKRKKVTSSARYKALGNSIALPFWRYLARRIMAQYEKKDVTMGSLFDGISGFPLVFKECGCEPRWSSEIECFPIAVCKQHFGDEETGQEGDIAKYL